MPSGIFLEVSLVLDTESPTLLWPASQLLLFRVALLLGYTGELLTQSQLNAPWADCEHH